VSGTGVETRPEAGAEAGRELSRWDWTDVLLSVPLAVVLIGAIQFGLAAVTLPLMPQHDHELRTAVTRFLSGFSLYAGVVGAVVLLVVGRRRTPVSALGWRPASTRWLLLAIPLALAGYVLVVIAGVIGNLLFPHAHNGQPQAVRNAFGHYQLLAVVAVSVIAPIAEETFFRGFLYGWLRRRVPLWAAVALSALVFSAAHAELALLIPIFVLGCLLALVYERSGSLLPGMIIHAVFNLIGITLIFASGR
jgi:membrane protease YdiL (CAAX protease family)